MEQAPMQSSPSVSPGASAAKTQGVSGLYAAYQVGRWINEIESLIPQVTVGLRNVSDIQAVLNQIACQIGLFMPPDHCDKIRTMIDRANKELGEFEGAEWLFDEQGLPKYDELPSEKFCDDFDRYTLIAQGCSLPPLDAITGFNPSCQASRIIQLGRYVDKIVHPIPAIEFRETVPRSNDLLNLSILTPNKWTFDKPHYPLEDIIKYYVAPPPTNGDCDHILQLCQEAGLTIKLPQIQKILANIPPGTLDWTQSLTKFDHIIQHSVSDNTKKRSQSPRRRGRTRIKETAEQQKWYRAYCQSKGRDGKVSMKELANKLRVDYITLAKVIKRLVERARVKKHRAQ